MLSSLEYLVILCRMMSFRPWSGGCVSDYYCFASVGIFARKEKISEENYNLVQALIRVVGRQITDVQKHRVKALDGKLATEMR